jgi:hypothetical protein
LACGIALLPTLLYGAIPPEVKVQDALQRWEAIRQSGEQAALEDCAKTVQELAGKGDVAVTARLMGITQDRSQPRSSRVLALHVACALADSHTAELIIDTFEVQLAYRPAIRKSNGACRSRRNRPGEAPRRPRRTDRHKDQRLAAVVAELTLTHEFVLASNSLLDKLPDHRRIHALALEVCSRPTSLFPDRRAAERLVLRCRVSQDDWDARVLEMLADGKLRLVPEEVIDRLSPTVLEPLREMVRAHLTLGEFHHAAADVLAHLGDREINPVLDAACEQGAITEDQLHMLAWRIDVQHPPTNLLAYIASEQRRRYRKPREWAVRRAHKLGVDPVAIREAILARARNVGTLHVHGLKQIALELGIMQPDDLPNVSGPALFGTP